MIQEIPLVLIYEDELSEAVLRKLLMTSGRPFVIDNAIRAYGAVRIKSSLEKYKGACRAIPHIVLTDLDQQPCAPRLLAEWGAQNLPSELLFRVAVREVEAWLLADGPGLSTFLGVPVNRMPIRPDDLLDPKQELLSIARRGNRKRLIDELVPPHGSKVSIGPLYNQRLTYFVMERWDVAVACAASPSLAKAVRRIGQFMV